MSLTGTLLNVDWLGQNALRNYPLVDGVSGKDSTGGFTLPKNLIVDLAISLPASATIDPFTFHVGQVDSFGSGVRLTLSRTVGGVTSAVGTVDVDAATHTRNAVYRFAGVGDYSLAVGLVTIGELDATLAYSGSWSISLANGRILPRCLQFSAPGVSSLRVVNGGSISAPMVGEIFITQGRNMGISAVVQDDTALITLNALARTELNADCGCEDAAALPPPIRSISGVVPNSVGEITLVGDNCIGVRGSLKDHSLTLSDDCAKPCCGDPELGIVQTSVTNLEIDVRGMRNLVNNLESRLGSMDSVLALIQSSRMLA